MEVKFTPGVSWFGSQPESFRKDRHLLLKFLRRVISVKERNVLHSLHFRLMNRHGLYEKVEDDLSRVVFDTNGNVCVTRSN